ncbi:MAG TPA: hypothetical protein PLF13_09235 [candidate division Zixibacteria bacterium]|nr:hypothetical protein [candidate division Zixibacteria bacterium]
MESSDSSPGITIGNTWYDQQHFGRMNRMVDWGYDATNGFVVHFLWTFLSDAVATDHVYCYNAYISNDGSYVDPVSVQASGSIGGFVALDVTDDNRAVAGGRSNDGTGCNSQVYWDWSPAAGFFGAGLRIPDSVLNFMMCDPVPCEFSALWPSMVYQEVPGQTPVLHLFAPTIDANHSESTGLWYFRKVGVNDGGTFDYPPYIVDTVFNVAQDVSASLYDGKVALVWIANRPEEGACDTCSSNGGLLYSEWDNDIYYQISYDYGVTWQPRVNLTHNEDGVDGYRPYTDISSLIDSDDYLHIAWAGRFWPADANSGGQAGLYRCRLFHWGENLGTGGYSQGEPIIRTAANLEWDQTVCSPGVWNLNGAKISLSECDGKFYYLYVQYNDIPAGVENDCAAWGMSGTYKAGAANGELYLTVSNSGGLTWDQPWNLTNTHTAGCDPTSGSDCASENWPSMARFGTNLTGTYGFPSGAVVDPTGSYTGGYYLDIQYILDRDAGAVLQDEGTWQQDDVKWMRVPCLESRPHTYLYVDPVSVGYPTNVHHGEQLDVPLYLANWGNIDLNLNISVNETSGPVSGWLDCDLVGDLSLPADLNNTAEGIINLNVGGVVNDPGTIVVLKGNVTISGNMEDSPWPIQIEAWVADTIVIPEWDTLTSCCLALMVGTNGNFGNQGRGGVNLDFFNCGDCDYVSAGGWDSVPGDASVYLFDGSPIICWTDETDTVRCNYSMYGESYLSDHGFYPMAHNEAVNMGDYDLYESQFVTRDSAIMLEQRWIIPTAGDTCDFAMKHLRVYSNDGQTHAGLAIGDGMDWDIPSDSGSWNSSGFDMQRRFFYQRGVEISDSLGDALECQDNDLRFGGAGILSIFENGEEATSFHNMYSMDNYTQVYQFGYFENDSLWKYMGDIVGYSVSDSAAADLYTVFTYRWNYTLEPGDTVDVYTLYVTSKDGEADLLNRYDRAEGWACELLGLPNGCCEVMGDANHSGAGPDISDLVYLVTWMFSGGPPPPCPEEMDCNGDGSCCDISDLVCWVNCMFAGGWCPEECL